MKSISVEAKVGAVTLISLALLGYMIVYLGAVSFGEQGYPVKAAFSQVSGLRPGNLVRYAGVDVGQVEAVNVGPQGVQVLLRILPKVKIPAGSRFTIGTDGLLGEKYIDIIPARTYTGFIQPNEQVQGEPPKGLDHFMAIADVVLEKLDKLLNSFNEVFGDQEVKQALKTSALNAKQITENLNQLAETMARIAVNNEQDINMMVNNLQAMSKSLRSVAGRVDRMVTGIDNNGQTVKDLRETIANIKSTSRRIENMAKSLEGVVTDPKTAKNLKETLQNAHDATEKANRMLTRFENVKTEASVEVLYPTKDNDYRSNAQLRIQTTPKDFAIIGVTDIGESNHLNLQFGKGTDKWSHRAGVIEGKAGLGFDARINSNFKLSVDLYDPNNFKVQLRTEFKIAPDTYLIGQNSSLNKDADKHTYIGIRRAF